MGQMRHEGYVSEVSGEVSRSKMSNAALVCQDGSAIAWSPAGLMIASPAGMGMGTVAE